MLDNPAVTAFLARWRRSINTYSQEQFAEELRELVDAQGRDGPTFSEELTTAMRDAANLNQHCDYCKGKTLYGWIEHNGIGHPGSVIPCPKCSPHLVGAILVAAPNGDEHPGGCG